MHAIKAMVIATLLSGCAALPSTMEVRVDNARMTQPAALAKYKAETGKDFEGFEASCIDIYCAEDQWGRAIQTSLDNHRMLKAKEAEKERAANIKVEEAKAIAEFDLCSKSRDCQLKRAAQSRADATAIFAQTSTAIMDMGISPSVIKATCERAVKGFKLGEPDNSEATFIVSNHFLNAMIAYSNAGFQESAQLLYNARDSARYLANELSDACIEIHKANAIVAGSNKQK